jgi:hypothetical protein
MNWHDVMPKMRAEKNNESMLVRGGNKCNSESAVRFGLAAFS